MLAAEAAGSEGLELPGAGVCLRCAHGSSVLGWAGGGANPLATFLKQLH